MNLKSNKNRINVTNLTHRVNESSCTALKKTGEENKPAERRDLPLFEPWARLRTDMALFFSGAVTSSPIKQRRTRSDHSCQSLNLSLLSPDCSYVCYSSDSAGSPCCCRRSPRLLTNGYYVMTEDSFSWDDDGNVSLTPAKTNVSYKENLVRIFRRRRRPRRSLVSLLSDMTETCQSWLDERVFGGVFSIPPAEPSWVEHSTATELDSSCSFTYDHTEIISPPDKVAPPSETLIQEEICTETCHSKEQFTQSLSGLSEVPPPLAFHINSCCPSTPPEQSGLTAMKSLFIFIFMMFIFTAVSSRCLLWGLAVASATFIMIMTFMFFTKSGPMGKWRTAKTEDITSKNE
ncbi:transmembrane protein 71 [Polymixia lowei]